MNKHRTRLMKLCAGLLVLGVWMSVEAYAQDINRLASKFTKFDGFELSTTLAPTAGGSGGITIFSKTVFVSAFISQTPVLFVTVSATGDTHNGTANDFSCLVDSSPCNGGFGTTPTGWISLQRHGVTEDFHDNGIYYTWCKVTTPGSHTVRVKMASDDGVNPVFLQTAYFFVDAAAPSGIDACSSF